MSVTEQRIIGELVAENYRYAGVFRKAGIDFCCNGNRTIKEACEQKNISLAFLLEQLQNTSVSGGDERIDYQSWPLDLLADYIEKKHHRYVEQRIQEIQPFLSKIVKVHGDRHPELVEVEKLFGESAGELTAHMKKEELILFPYIRKIVQTPKSGTAISASFGTVQNPIRMMKHEHDTEGERFRKISELTNQYTPPADACNTYSVTLSLLKEFEEDLHLHIHLENNILFPNSVSLEMQHNSL